MVKQASCTRRSVLAACGCGHEGRLGFGEPLQRQDLQSTPAVTLLPFFLDTLAAAGDQVRSVHCGGYHTLALTEAGALYGWGVHEEGQLGLGRLSRSDVKPYFAAPVRLTFFDDLFKSEVQHHSWLEMEKERFIIDVSCGASHSIVLTQTGLYACGKNSYGQLGIGTDVDVYEWVPVLSCLGERSVLRREVQCAVDGADPLAAPSPPPFSKQKRYVSLVKGTLTHLSCGTHHTLLGWKNALIERYDESEDGIAGVLEYHPVLVLAAGKGDFGELGYDGDQLSILQAKEKRQHSAIQLEAKRVAMQGGLNTDQNGNNAVMEQRYSDAWWKRQQTKQRRPEFFSSLFMPVDLPPLGEDVIRVSHELSSEVLHTLGEGVNSKSASRWGIISLRAMHLHSSVRLRRETADSTQAEDLPVLHWGCYYCGEVEGIESSIPREQGNGEVDLHAANELMLCYPSGVAPLPSPAVSVRGSGVLGTGEEDDLQVEWCAIAAPAGEMSRWGRVERVTGRDHILLLVDKQASDGSGTMTREVWGFGANLHGQLAQEREDVVATPTCVLREGDPLQLPTTVAVPVDLSGTWVVERIRDVGAGVNHSFFLVDVVRNEEI